MSATVELTLKPSRYLIAILAFTYLAGLCALLLLPWPLWLRIALGLVLLRQAYKDWQYHHGRCLEWISKVRWNQQVWQLQTKEGNQTYELKQVTLWSWLLVLNFRQSSSGKIRSVIVLPDSCDAEVLRELRVLLRNQPVFETTKGISASSSRG